MKMIQNKPEVVIKSNSRDPWKETVHKSLRKTVLMLLEHPIFILQGDDLIL